MFASPLLASALCSPGGWCTSSHSPNGVQRRGPRAVPLVQVLGYLSNHAFTTTTPTSRWPCRRPSTSSSVTTATTSGDPHPRPEQSVYSVSQLQATLCSASRPSTHTNHTVPLTPHGSDCSRTSMRRLCRGEVFLAHGMPWSYVGINMDMGLVVALSRLVGTIRTALK
ncbi:hypothetical protein BV898_14577 [Hypsibius exemplaris]|uniref:Secreted protein n=1 Tax=Hypsibius exemplaris TaxID=2072580 RepID=A0A9X6RJJ8_HYPEX|nr:hypothetical protein BV898_14577 [Hypsibius exemplaris]